MIRQLYAICLLLAWSLFAHLALAQDRKWPVQITRSDGHDTGNTVCASKESYREFGTKYGPVSDQNKYKNYATFFKSGKCYDLMSNWKVEIENPKNITRDPATFYIKTSNGKKLIAYGAPIDPD